MNKEKELYQNKVNFFTEVAHEIRTPLTLIDAPLEAIEEIGINNSRVQHYLKVTRQNTKRLLNLTGQLLDFQKIDSNRLTFKYENVDISALVNETIDRFEPAMTLKNKELIRNVADEPVIVSTDREAVIKILSNLLNNALKYARRRVKVSLTTDDSNFIIKGYERRRQDIRQREEANLQALLPDRQVEQRRERRGHRPSAFAFARIAAGRKS